MYTDDCTQNQFKSRCPGATPGSRQAAKSTASRPERGRSVRRLWSGYARWDIIIFSWEEEVPFELVTQTNLSTEQLTRTSQCLF